VSCRSDEHAEDYISDNICDRCHLRPSAEGKVTLRYLINRRGKSILGEFTTKPDKYMSADVEFGTKHTSGPPGSRVDTPPSLNRESSTTAKSTTRSPLTIFGGPLDQFYPKFDDHRVCPVLAFVEHSDNYPGGAAPLLCHLSDEEDEHYIREVIDKRLALPKDSEGKVDITISSYGGRKTMMIKCGVKPDGPADLVVSIKAFEEQRRDV
jgi:hypothetical protein